MKVGQNGVDTAYRIDWKDVVLILESNSSFHYGSDVGAEMAATYHSVIETVKLHGSSIWNIIGTFFKKYL